MKMCLAILAICFIATASAQSYSGQLYTFGADIAARSQGDINSVTGYTRVRTINGNQLFYESALNGAQQITAVHIHLSLRKEDVDGGPLVLALTNTSTNPLSATSSPLVQTGTRSDSDLASNPQLAAARQGIVNLGIKDNTLQNIGDIDRLLRQGVLYSDVHSTTRVSPNRVGSGAFNALPSNLGKRMA